jgi:spore coat polysaccharide biosynthesis protein SpsF (cytidylyltransferase family)/aryl-alcohol dehydrogenase-like predicted oxidoreductase
MRKTIIILQARMSSDRLPYKSAALIHGIPLAILCALRLSNKGHQLILATSKHNSDDYLVKLCSLYKIKYYRGDLQNVLKRFIQCTSNLDDQSIIVRATADNPINDGDIVSYALEQFKKNSLDYFSMPTKSTKLPLGLGVEVIRLYKLRELFNANPNKLDCEHVTHRFSKSFIPRHEYYFKIKSRIKFNYKVTVDNLLDYFALLELLKEFKNISQISWKKIIKNKNTIKLNFIKKNINCIKGKLILGGAQIGMNYGKKKDKIINNKDLNKIFLIMRKCRINAIDSANSYMKSENRIGNYNQISKKDNFFIFSKISEIKNISNKSNSEILSIIFNQLYSSLYNLKLNKLNVLMIHSVYNYLKKKSIFDQAFNMMIKRNFVSKFGISIYYPQELKLCVNRLFSYIQIPINVIDRRWSFDKIIELKNKHKVKIIARSIFLRGLLLKKSNWPTWFKESYKLNKVFDHLIRDLKIKDRMSLCLRYIHSLTFIDSIVIGVNSLHQFKQILIDKNYKIFTKAEIIRISEAFSLRSKRILDAKNF